MAWEDRPKADAKEAAAKRKPGRAQPQKRRTDSGPAGGPNA